MTKLCSALLKCEYKLKFVEKIKAKKIDCTLMRARVEKVDVLGWTKPLKFLCRGIKGFLSNACTTFMHATTGRAEP